LKVRKIELFRDREATVPLAEIISETSVVDMGEIDVGDTKVMPFVMKNTGETNMTSITITSPFPGVTFDGIPDRLNVSETATCILQWHPFDEDLEGLFIEELIISAKSVGLS
jgi:hypothetical protein